MWKFGAIWILVLAYLSHRIHDQFFPDVPCVNETITWTLENNTTHSWDACQVFSWDYQSAREKFRAGVRRLENAQQLHSLTIVDDSLTTDIAIVPGSAPGVLLRTSGTHGIEGYAGSAIQLAILDYLNSHSQALSSLPTLVMIHAVNPYGMKYYRRFNEHNVDLNRNGISNFAQFLDTRDPNIAGYDDFRSFTFPATAPTAWDKTLGFWWNALPLLAKHGYAKLKTVLVSGQYHHPEGIFYGGQELQESYVQLQHFLLQPQKEDGKCLLDSSPLVWIDVHTGLGKFGQDTLMPDGKDSSVDALRKWFPTAASIVTEESDDKAAMEGYDLTRGMLPAYFRTLTPPKSLLLTQEFGTIPGVLVARALILENAMVQHAVSKCKDCNSDNFGRRSMIQAFYPQSPEWRASIVQRGVSLFLQSVAFLKENEI